MKDDRIAEAFGCAKELYEGLGVDVDAAVRLADSIPISMHSWQGDDLIGFDGTGELTGGIAATGNYPGRARTADELRADLVEAMSMIPGAKRVNLHACHAETGGKRVDRDAYSVDYFGNWLDWAKDRGLGMDFNPTFFSHPRMDGNFSLASLDEGTRKFWIEHGRRCREIGAEFGKRQGSPCIVNFWMPDGYKDVPADTVVLRALMLESLDAIFEHRFKAAFLKDALESKLFGLGLESYTVASHEFSLGYAITRKILYTLDAGHFHPTEGIADKLSSALMFVPEILLHVSRGVRWDSDHVVILDDALQSIANELVRNKLLSRTHIGLDFFDASINRIAAWTIGTRNTLKSLLIALLEPPALREAEKSGDYTARLALMEDAKGLPWGAVWDQYCQAQNVPAGNDWMADVKSYESKVLSKRI